MPAMIRVPGKATKIAYNILGKPQNMQSKMMKKNSQVNKRLIFEETRKVR
jgi:hypothetical protein